MSINFTSLRCFQPLTASHHAQKSIRTPCCDLSSTGPQIQPSSSLTPFQPHPLPCSFLNTLPPQGLYAWLLPVVSKFPGSNILMLTRFIQVSMKVIFGNYPVSKRRSLISLCSSIYSSLFTALNTPTS